jgi:hypothetical protein
MDIQADDFYSRIHDTTYATGYGWFIFFNATTSKASSISNPIPYAGFEDYAVKEIFDAFDSILNNKELALVSMVDRFRWLNEGYNKLTNALNLIIREYNVPAEWTFTVTASDREVELPSNFGELLSVKDSYGDDIDYIN